TKLIVTAPSAALAFIAISAAMAAAARKRGRDGVMGARAVTSARVCRPPRRGVGNDSMGFRQRSGMRASRHALEFIGTVHRSNVRSTSNNEKVLRILQLRRASP